MSDTAIAINWFEIPVSNLDRATKFYQSILDVALIPMDAPNGKMQAIPGAEGNPVGALVQTAQNQPSATGPLIYLGNGGDLSSILDKVADAGGQVLVPKTDIGPYGSIAQFSDTEGNRIALHNR